VGHFERDAIEALSGSREAATALDRVEDLQCFQANSPATHIFNKVELLGQYFPIL
jgi:hypothetical protein